MSVVSASTGPTPSAESIASAPTCASPIAVASIAAPTLSPSPKSAGDNSTSTPSAASVSTQPGPDSAMSASATASVPSWSAASVSKTAVASPASGEVASTVSMSGAVSPAQLLASASAATSARTATSTDVAERSVGAPEYRTGGIVDGAQASSDAASQPAANGCPQLEFPRHRLRSGLLTWGMVGLFSCDAWCALSARKHGRIVRCCKRRSLPRV